MEGKPDPKEMVEQHKTVTALERIAMAAAWALRNWPADERIKKRRRSGRGKPDANPTCIGTHKVEPRIGGGLQCRDCKLYAATPTSLRSLRQVKCRGNIATQCHGTHALRYVEGLLYCRNCGAYATKRPTSLKQMCNRTPLNEARRNVLRRLAAGLLPTTAKYLKELAAEEEAKSARAATVNEAARSDAVTANDEDRGAVTTRVSDHERSYRTLVGDNGGHERDEVNVNAAARPLQRLGQDAIGSSSSSANAHGTTVTAGSSTGSDALVQWEHALPDGMGRQHVAGEQASNASSPHQMEGRGRRSDWCKPTASPLAPWIRRIKIGVGDLARECHLCGRIARAACRGCHATMCIDCAKSRRECRVNASADEAGGT